MKKYDDLSSSNSSSLFRLELPVLTVNNRIVPYAHGSEYQQKIIHEELRNTNPEAFMTKVYQLPGLAECVYSVIFLEPTATK